MDKLSLSTVITLLLSLTSVEKSTGQCTTFQFTAQAPIPLNCNPFTDDSIPRWRLRVMCRAERRSGSGGPFEIHWIHRDNNGAVEDLGMPEASTYNDNVKRAESFFGNQYININEGFSDSMLGQYWCEVYSGGSPTGAHSDGFTILRPEEYSQQTVCSGINNNIVNLCRDEPPAQPLILPTTTTSITPLQSTTSSAVPIQVTTSTLAVELEQSTLHSALPSQQKESTSNSVVDRPPPSTLITTSITVSSSNSLLIRLSTTLPVPTTTSIPVVRTSLLHSDSISVQRGTTMTTPQTRSQTSFSKALSNPTSVFHYSSPIEVIINTEQGKALSSVFHYSSPIEGILNTEVLLSTSQSSGLGTTVHTSSSVSSVVVSPSIIPAGQLDKKQMDFLLLTAILLIVFLTIIIILLLVIACLMKCGVKPRVQRTDHKHSHCSQMSSARTLEFQLLKQRDINPEEPLQTPYTLTSDNPHPPNHHHRYSTINDSFTSSNKPSATSQIEILKMPPLKPPSIIKSKSPSPSPFSKSTTSSTQHPSASPLSEGSFQYSKLRYEDKGSSDPHKYSGCTTAPLEGSDEQENSYSILNETQDIRNSENVDNPNLTSKGLERGAIPGPTHIHVTKGVCKPEKLKETKDVRGQLENWDYQWNPMYMKIPVGLRIINTL